MPKLVSWALKLQIPLEIDGQGTCGPNNEDSKQGGLLCEKTFDQNLSLKPIAHPMANTSNTHEAVKTRLMFLEL